MSKTTYFFQHRSDKKKVVPITHSHPYHAVQELRNSGVNVDEWRMVKITETTFCNRSIASIESNYLAMRPRNDRKVATKEDEE
jgi:hypothetical protein